jgi:hypothetical protein
MKLCSQCEFIYEDDQERCDMDGAELVHEPTLEHVFPNNTLQAKAEMERVPARLIIPLSRLQQAETSKTQPKVFVARKRFALQIAAGFLLTVVAFASFYAAARLFQPRAQTATNTLKTSYSSVVSGASSSLDKPETPNAKIEPSQSLAQTRNSKIATAPSSDKIETQGSNRETPIPALPRVKPLPRLKPLPTLKPLPRLADQRRSLSVSRKAPVHNAKQMDNSKKESRFGSFIKKTGRILTKPFKS